MLTKGGISPTFCHAIILVMTFTDRARKLIRTFLGTESNEFITTESGLKLQISDSSWADKIKSS